MCQTFDPAPYPIDIFYESGNLVINNGRVIGPEPTPGEWTHVAITCSGGGGADLKVYYNKKKCTFMNFITTINANKKDNNL